MQGIRTLYSTNFKVLNTEVENGKINDLTETGRMIIYTVSMVINTVSVIVRVVVCDKHEQLTDN